MKLSIPGKAELTINPEFVEVLENFKGRVKKKRGGVTYGVVFAIAKDAKGKVIKMTRFFDYLSDAEDFRNLVKDVRGRVYTGIIGEEEGETK